MGDLDPRPEDEEVVQLDDESMVQPGSDERLDSVELSDRSNVRAADR